MNTKLNNRPLYEDVAERLRAQIFAHELAPGSWLDEQSLAAQFGISRTPMREAIKVLASEGLVTMKLRRGAYVTEVDRRDLEQIFTILSLLEGQAAKETATKATEAHLTQLDDLHHRLEKAAADRDMEQFFEINVKFHELIQEIAGKHIQVVSQGPIVADKLGQYLVAHPEMEGKLTKNASQVFYSSESEIVFNEKAARFLGYPVAAKHHSF